MSYSLFSPQTSSTCSPTLLSAEDSCLKRTATSFHLNTPQPTLFYTPTHCLPSRGEEPRAMSMLHYSLIHYLRVATHGHISYHCPSFLLLCQCFPFYLVFFFPLKTLPLTTSLSSYNFINLLIFNSSIAFKSCYTLQFFYFSFDSIAVGFLSSLFC